MSGRKNQYQNLSFYSSVVSADDQSIPLDMRFLDTCSFVIKSATGLAATFTVEGSIDGVTYVDVGIVIEPVDGVADSVRFALVNLALSYCRISISDVTGSGLVEIQAQGKGY